MKKALLLIIIIGFFSSGIKAQAPDLMNYQTVVRDASGNVLENQDVSFLISILEDSEPGNVVYSERHTVQTNQFGLANMQIGNGTTVSGDITGINWGSKNHFLKIEMDPSGGTSYSLMGSQQLVSVPYALHAKTVEIDNVDDADADASNELQTISISGTVLTLSNNGGSVTLPTAGGGGDNWGTQTVVADATLSGNGTSADPLKLAQQSATSAQVLGWDGVGWSPKNDEKNDADADPSNELQTISISGTVLTLSNNGGSVTLPSAGNGGDNWGTQTAVTDPTLSGDGTSADPLKLAQQSATTGQVLEWDGTQWKPSDININDADADATNELQTMSISGTILTLSNGGGSVTLPSSGSGGDNWGTQTVVANSTLIGEGTTANPLGVNGDLTDDQTLSISGNELSISNGNSVNLPASPGDGDAWGVDGEDQTSFISRSGKVGIGTSNPLSPLSVGGDGDSKSTISAENIMELGTAINGVDISQSSGSVGGRFYSSAGSAVSGIAGNSTIRTYGGNFESNSDFGTGAYGVGHIGVEGRSIDDAGYGITGTSPFWGGYFYNSSVSDKYVLLGGENYALLINDGNEGAGKVLTSDALGNASWQDASSGSDGDAWGVTGEDQAGNIIRSGNVGIGTLDPKSKLSVGGEGFTGGTISAYNNEAGGVGIYAESSSPESNGTGGAFYSRATSDNSYGVIGVSLSQTGKTSGGYFESNSSEGTGVSGVGKNGVYGLTSANQGAGVYGESKEMSNITYGGHFYAPGSYGRGVYGFGGDYGVHGRSENGYGGAFNNASNPNIAVFLAGSNFAVKIMDGNQGEGRVLTSDEGGYATWKDLPSIGDGDAWGVDGEDKVSIITRTGNVGIGTSNPISKLSVGGEGFSDYAISGYESQSGGVGVFGTSTASSGSGFGGWFTSNSNTGFGIGATSPFWGGSFQNSGNSKAVYLAGQSYAMQIRDGGEGEGKVLTSDIHGNASWQDLPAAAGDNWGNQVVVSYSSLTGNGTMASPLEVNGDLTDDQTLSISGNELTISGGNSVTLPASGGGDGDAWNVSGEDQASNIGRTGRVGIGTTSPSYPLHVQGNSSGGAGYFKNTITSSDQMGVYGECANSDYYGYGGCFKGGYVGVLGIVDPSGGSNYIGVYGRSNGGSGTKYGVRGQASGSGTNYGIYGEASSGNTNYGIYCSGDGVYTGNWSHSSDKKLKKNFEPINNALAKVAQLKPKYFNYRADEFPEMNLPEKRQLGFIAQEIREVLPELVSTAIQISPEDKGSNGIEYLTVDYVSVIPVLTAAIKELNELVNQKQAELDELNTQNEIIIERLLKLEELNNMTSEIRD